MLKKIRETEKEGKQESKKNVQALTETLHTLYASDIIITITRDTHIRGDQIMHRDAHDTYLWVLSGKFSSRQPSQAQNYEVAPRFLGNVFTLNHIIIIIIICSAKKSLWSRSVVHIENANSSAVDSGPYKTQAWMKEQSCGSYITKLERCGVDRIEP